MLVLAEQIPTPGGAAYRALIALGTYNCYRYSSNGHHYSSQLSAGHLNQTKPSRIL